VELSISADTRPMTHDSTVVPDLSRSDCPVCMVPHDEEIHEATLGLREWFRFEVTKYLFDEEEVEVDDSGMEWFLVA
jgi:hypothetical protein